MNASAIVRAPLGYVDADAVARYSNGAPLVAEHDGCGAEYEQARHTNSTAPQEVLVNGPIAAVVSKSSHKYFHWMVENLPRVASLLGADTSVDWATPPRCYMPACKTNRDLRLLVSCKGAHVKESLALLGIHEKRVVCFERNHVYRTTTTLLWPQAVCGGVRAPTAVMLRKAMHPELRPVTDLREVMQSGKVIVHRSRAHSRALVNHGHVMTALRAEPSLRTALQELAGSGGSGGAGTISSTSLRSQVELFRGARCQVGPHNARMALMLFAPSPWFGTAEISPGAYFVAINSNDKPRAQGGGISIHINRHPNHPNHTSQWISSPRPNDCFQGLAATLGMRHEWIIIPGATATDDMMPDPVKVAAMALRMCTQRFHAFDF